MSAPRTILMTINTSWNIVNFRASLIQALQAAGYQVITAAPADAHTEQLRMMVDTHYDLPMQNEGTSPLHDAVLFVRYLRLFARTKPDVMLGYTIKPNVYGTLAARLLGVKVINNVSGLGTVFIKQNWLTKLARGLYQLAFWRTNHVFFQNEADQSLFIEYGLVDAAKTSVVPGSGIDLTRFQPDDTAPKDAGEPCDFILIARLLWDKGIGEYVDAARRVNAWHPACRFRLLGPLGVSNKTAISPQQVAQWEAEGVIEYLGEKPDVRGDMLAHDALVLPSYREGMSRVLIEACALGRPIITTDVPGCRHVVTHEKNGLLCKLKDAEDLAAQMRRFIALTADEKSAMASAARYKAEATFDEALVHRAYLEHIEQLTP